MDPILMAYASVIIISLVSFIGVLALVLKDITIRRYLPYFVGFSAGALLGDSFIHLLPEASEKAGFGAEISVFILLGIVVSFVIEKFIHWKHRHTMGSRTHPHPFAYMNLFGDAVHNFIDGLVVAASYLVSIPVGVATTIAVIFHEIPQEIGDFGVLLHGGFSRNRALMWNFVSALFAVLGAAIAILTNTYIENSITLLVAFAAGGFVYIAGADLIPELHKRMDVNSSLLQVVSMLLGMAVMYGLVLIE